MQNRETFSQAFKFLNHEMIFLSSLEIFYQFSRNFEISIFQEFKNLEIFKVLRNSEKMIKKFQDLKEKSFFFINFSWFRNLKAWQNVSRFREILKIIFFKFHEVPIFYTREIEISANVHGKNIKFSKRLKNIFFEHFLPKKIPKKIIYCSKAWQACHSNYACQSHFTIFRRLRVDIY